VYGIGGKEPGPGREGFDLVTGRAVTEMRLFVELALPLLRPGMAQVQGFLLGSRSGLGVMIHLATRRLIKLNPNAS